jgi:hypothetical protein
VRSTNLNVSPTDPDLDLVVTAGFGGDCGVDVTGRPESSGLRRVPLPGSAAGLSGRCGEGYPLGAGAAGQGAQGSEDVEGSVGPVVRARIGAGCGVAVVASCPAREKRLSRAAWAPSVGPGTWSGRVAASR